MARTSQHKQIERDSGLLNEEGATKITNDAKVAVG